VLAHIIYLSDLKLTPQVTSHFPNNGSSAQSAMGSVVRAHLLKSSTIGVISAACTQASVRPCKLVKDSLNFGERASFQ